MGGALEKLKKDRCDWKSSLANKVHGGGRKRAATAETHKY